MLFPTFSITLKQDEFLCPTYIEPDPSAAPDTDSRWEELERSDIERVVRRHLGGREVPAGLLQVVKLLRGTRCVESFSGGSIRHILRTADVGVTVCALETCMLRRELRSIGEVGVIETLGMGERSEMEK